MDAVKVLKQKLSEEEKQRRREEYDRQLAVLQAQAAALEAARAAELQGSGSEEDRPGLSSPPRKRKSDVLAEASPVKHKGMSPPYLSFMMAHAIAVIVRDDSLVVKAPEKKKLEFSKSLVNKRKSEADFYGSSSKLSSRSESSSTDHSKARIHQSSTSRSREDRNDRSTSTGNKSLDDLLSSEARSKRVSPSSRPQTEQSRSLSTSMRERSTAIVPKHERRSATASGSHASVKSEPHRPDDLPQPSRLASSLTARRRTGDRDPDEEASEGQKPFGKRDAGTLTVQEDLQTGPIKFGRDPEGMAEWTWVEPNSGINLRWV